MLRSDYFIKACQAGACSHLDWVFSVFCSSTDKAKYDYPYMLTQGPGGFFFKDEHGREIHIEDAPLGQAPFHWQDELTIVPGDIPNNFNEIVTNYGNLLANWLILVYAFGHKFPYINDKFSLGKIEQDLFLRLKNTPAEGEPREDKYLYVDEYLKYTDAVSHIAGFTQVVMIANTEKNILPPDGLKEFKEQLFREYEGRLHDPAALASLEKKLFEFDANWRGDDPGNNFLNVGSKAIKVSRKAKFLIKGAEEAVGGKSGEMFLIRNSLYEGIDPKDWPALVTTSRMGSYSRGQETMLAGVDVKWLGRISAGIRILDGFCGTKLGEPFLVQKADIPKILGFSVIDQKGGHIPLEDQATAESYIGKYIMVSSMMFCTMGEDDFCGVCAGPRLRETPDAASKSLSGEASIIMGISMSAMHGRILETHKLDLEATLY